MTTNDPEQWASYELPREAADGVLSAEAETAAGVSLSDQMLVDNALWLCKLRWVAIGILAVLGVAGLYPERFHSAQLRVRSDWPLVAAALIAAYNLLFLNHARRLKTVRARWHGAVANLWGQIVVDLLALTAAVHFVGSRETFIAFGYLFHIILACIFFSRPVSLLVTTLAGVLYLGCVSAEEMGLIPASMSVYVLSDSGHGGEAAALLNPISAVGIWLVVWYLTSRLSMIVRRRDHDLARANEQLREAQEERARHMLRTTHELKAPFAAIHANAQLLARGRCGPLSDEARQILARISARCNRLAHEIQEMLQLANLNSVGQHPPPRVELDLAALLTQCVTQFQLVAEGRQVRFDVDLVPASVTGVEDHLIMLFCNVLSNAVVYSREGGCVRIACRPAPDGGWTVTIADEGIGIPGDKLPRVFDEHYRTSEAAQHNKQSSGLGLTIVRRVAAMHGLGVRLASEVGKGTTVEIHLPDRSLATAAELGPDGNDGPAPLRPDEPAG